MVKLQAAGLSDRGLKRGHNEDSLSVIPDMGLFIVADGMGGHNAGEVASRQAIESIVDYLREGGNESSEPFQTDPQLTDLENKLVMGVKLANRDVCNLSLEHSEYSGMGTTLVGLYYLAEENRVLVAHVGDSRCYLMREGALSQLTLDHSWVSEQLQKKIITAEEAKNHRWKNVITRALGNKLDVEVDLLTRDARPWDTYLLCSDGLSGMIEDARIEEILATTPELEEAVEKLIQEANSNGGIDNISVILVRFLPDGDAPDDPDQTR